MIDLLPGRAAFTGDERGFSSRFGIVDFIRKTVTDSQIGGLNDRKLRSDLNSMSDWVCDTISNLYFRPIFRPIKF